MLALREPRRRRLLLDGAMIVSSPRRREGVAEPGDVEGGDGREETR